MPQVPGSRNTDPWIRDYKQRRAPAYGFQHTPPKHKLQRHLIYIIHRAIQSINKPVTISVSPKFFMPQAHIHLEDTCPLNDLRGVPDITDAFSFLVSQCKEKRIMAKGILLNSGACFDLRTERSSEEYRKLTADQRQSFIRNISEKKYDYELLPHPKEKEILDIFPGRERFERKRQEI